MFELETGLIFWTSVSFAILVVLLYKILLPPILMVIDKREKQIADSIDNAAKIKKDAADLLAQYHKKIEVAHHDANKILENSKVEAQSVIKEAADQAKHEAQMIVAQARVEIEAEKKKMFKEVKDISADLIVAAAGKVLEREVNKEDNLRIINEELNEISRL